MEKPTNEIDEKSWGIGISEGIMKVVDVETKNEIFLPRVDRDRFIASRNLLYALVADGPLYVGVGSF